MVVILPLASGQQSFQAVTARHRRAGTQAAAAAVLVALVPVKTRARQRAALEIITLVAVALAARSTMPGVPGRTLTPRTALAAALGGATQLALG
jgi:hypothetical protein